MDRDKFIMTPVEWFEGQRNDMKDYTENLMYVY